MPELPEPISHTVEAIYAGIVAKARPFGDSRGVPMSDVANECERAIWYKLRWASKSEQSDGPKQRRFGTGFREEERLLDDLEAAGFKVERVDPATGKQFQIQLANGWLRGKMDGRVTGLPEAAQTLHVVECKSHNEKSFKELIKKKLQLGKPDHYAQCQSYMHAEALQRCLYLAVNKNTDELYAERVEYDAVFALKLEAKVHRVVRTDRAPPKLHEDSTAKSAFACGWCPALTLCHEKAWARINCRTCLNAEFLDGAEVRCVAKDKFLTYPEQQAGCSFHRWLPDLVPGEQVDVSGKDIIYQLADGTVWQDEDGKC